MMDFLTAAPLWLLTVLLVLQGAIIWLTDWLAYQRGFSEAEDFDLMQQRLDFERGTIEGVRRSAQWLREHEHTAQAVGLHLALLDRETTDRND